MHADVIEVIEYVRELRQSSTLISVGVSLGAAVMTNALAVMKDKCPIVAATGVSCHYDTKEVMSHMRSHYLGAYDYILGTYGRMAATPMIEKVDLLNMKNCPQKVIGEELQKIYTLN